MKKILSLIIIGILCIPMLSLVIPRVRAPASETALQVAEKAAAWTISQAVSENGGYKWLGYLQGPYYSSTVPFGSAGFGTFYLELYKETGNSMYLDYAKGAAQWVISQAVSDSGGYKWPHPDDDINNPGWWLSPMVSGIGDFLLQMYEATNDNAYLNYASGAAQWLMAMAYWGEPGCFIPYNPPGIYGTQASHGIGPGREAYTMTFLLHMYEETGNSVYLPYVEGMATWLISGPDIIVESDGYTWHFNRPYGSSLSIEGTARIALYFYEAYQTLGNAQYLQYASGAMNWLLNRATQTGNQAKWLDPYGGFHKSLPFSDMQGVEGFWGMPEPNDLLSQVYDITLNATYLDYAKQLANWIISPNIAVPEGGGYKFPVFEGTSDYSAFQNAKIYNFLSWLYSVTGETAYRDYADGALQWIILTATESNGGYEWTTIPWFPYYAPWFEPGAAGIGYYLATAPSVGLQPDFEFSAPTTTVILHAGELEKQESLELKSLNGYSGSIQLSYSDSPQGSSEGRIKIEMPTSVGVPAGGTNSPHIWFSSIFYNGRFAALGEYKFVISATDGSLKHDLTITVKLVANTIAINNLVHLQQIPKNDPTFTIQQNFLIAKSDGSVLYWIQNIVCVRPNPALASGCRIWSTFQAGTENTNFLLPPPQAAIWPYMGNLAMYVASKIVSFPTVLNLTSYIDGNNLILTNNASSLKLFNTVTLTLPSGSYIVGYSDKYQHQFMGKTYTYAHASPEIAIVGFTPLTPTADFNSGTKGSVECNVRLFGASSWSSTIARLMYGKKDVDSNPPQTAERSLHLAWYLDGTFKYDVTKNNPSTAPQGISFSPDYP